MPIPPRRHGRAKRFLSKSLGGALPVKTGIYEVVSNGILQWQKPYYLREEPHRVPPLPCLCMQLVFVHLFTVSCDVKQVWYADDATAAGQLEIYGTTWSRLWIFCPSKTSLIVKESHYQDAIADFEKTDVSITTEGKSHLGAALGTEDFVQAFVNGKVQQWVEEVKHLSSIAQTQPHAAYSAFVFV